MAAPLIYPLARNSILTYAGVSSPTAAALWAGLTANSSALCGSFVAITGGSFGTTNYQQLATDQFFGTIPASSVLAGTVASPVSFPTSKTASAGALTVGSIVFTVSPNTLGTGGTNMPGGALVVWINSGTAGTSPLVCYIDYNNWAPGNVAIQGTGSTITFNFSSFLFTL